jgi:hypothetical protein
MKLSDLNQIMGFDSPWASIDNGAPTQPLAGDMKFNWMKIKQI